MLLLQYLGTFPDEASAARAYDMACIATKGQRAVLNFPTTDYVDLNTGKLKEGLPWEVPSAALARAATKSTRSSIKRRGSGEAAPRKRARTTKPSKVQDSETEDDSE